MKGLTWYRVSRILTHSGCKIEFVYGNYSQDSEIQQVGFHKCAPFKFSCLHVFPRDEKMEVFLELLNSYSGRDSIIRAVSYLSLYFSGHTRGTKSLKFKKISEELSHCRLILRLFDDLPMLRHTVTYGLGEKESGIFFRLLGILKNIVDQIYYPIEHIAWAADLSLIKTKSDKYSSIGVALWALSSYISIIRSLIMMSQLQKKTYGLKNVTIHENIVKEQLELLLYAFKNVADLVIAINYFPSGSLLWAGKLNMKQIGLCGIISSFLRLLMIVKSMKRENGPAVK